MKTRKVASTQYQAKDGTWHWTKDLAESYNRNLDQKAERKRKSIIKSSIKKGYIEFNNSGANFYVCETQEQADVLGVPAIGIWVYVIKYIDDWGDAVGEYMSLSDYIDSVEEYIEQLKNLEME